MNGHSLQLSLALFTLAVTAVNQGLLAITRPVADRSQTD